MTRFDVARSGVVLVAAILAVTRPVAAQVPWDSPQLLAPGSPAGISLLYVDFGLRPHDGTGVLAGYRTKAAPAGIGGRLAATIPDSDRVRVSGGVDVAVPMIAHSEAFPLDAIWTAGIGASYGDYHALGLTVGFAAGRVVTGEHIWFSPYMSTRITLESCFGDARPREQFGMALAADIGADLAFDQRRSVVLRSAVSLGDRRALVVGVHTALGR